MTISTVRQPVNLTQFKEYTKQCVVFKNYYYIVCKSAILSEDVNKKLNEHFEAIARYYDSVNTCIQNQEDVPEDILKERSLLMEDLDNVIQEQSNEGFDTIGQSNHIKIVQLFNAMAKNFILKIDEVRVAKKDIEECCNEKLLTDIQGTYKFFVRRQEGVTALNFFKFLKTSIKELK